MQQVDVLAIGAGLAGMSAAVAAAAQIGPRRRVALAAPSAYDGGCGRETHALNVAIAPGDSWIEHYRDTMYGGGQIADPRLVSTLCREAVHELAELEHAGVRFDTAMGGEHDLGAYGGSTHPRAVHRADLTGLDIMNTRLRQAISRGVVLLERLWMLDLIIADGRCHGAIFYDVNTASLCTIEAKATVLATGGGACVYPISTISPDKVASGIACALRNGLNCVDLEMVQFHPTGLAAPTRAGHGALIEEEMRTLGATLHNAHGERFMNAYDPRRECATRDVVSRACFAEIHEGRGTPAGAVVLDISRVRCSSLLERFPNSVRRLRAAGVDLLNQKRIETCPAAHFLMGGVQIDECARTALDGLFVCGEDAGGIHGGNRLGGNGVVDALVFGRIAGKHAAESALSAKATLVAGPLRVTLYDVPPERAAQIDQRLRRLMWTKGGLARDQSGLTGGLVEIAAVREELAASSVSVVAPTRVHPQLVRGHALAGRLLLAHAIVASALERPRSLAAHYCTDVVASSLETSPYSVGLKLDMQEPRAFRIIRSPADTDEAAVAA